MVIGGGGDDPMDNVVGDPDPLIDDPAAGSGGNVGARAGLFVLLRWTMLMTLQEFASPSNRLQRRP